MSKGRSRQSGPGGPTGQPPRRTEHEPPRGLGQAILRQLPRVGLLLFVVLALIVFRAVLLPFALAIFLAFLLYPLVSLLERGGIGGWKPPTWLPGRRALAAIPRMEWRIPRWSAVLLIYVAFFTFSYHAVPRVVRSLASQLGQLQTTVPRTFATMNQWQTSVQDKVSDVLEVERLGSSTREALLNGLKDLQTQSLQAPLPLPEIASEDGEGGSEPVASTAPEPTHFSLFNVEVIIGGRQPLALPAESAESSDPSADPLDGATGTDSPTDEAADLESDQGAEAVEGEGDQILPEEPEGAPKKLFSDEARANAHKELLAIVDEQLYKPGPAPPQLSEIAGEQVRRIGVEVLGLDRNDQGLRSLQSLVRERVASAIRREEYIEVFRDETGSALATARRWVGDQLKKTTAGVTALVTGVFDFFLILMLTAFFLVSFPRLISYARDLVPPAHRDDYTVILGRIDTRLNGAIRGQVIICIVNGVLTYPGLIWCGMLFEAPVLNDFAVLLSLVAMVLSLIPIFGVILSTIPMVLLSLTQSLWAAVAVVAWICVIHAIEAYILNPHILGHSARMNPILVIFALLAGKTFGGLVGALLAVPIASVIVALFGFYRRKMAEIYAAEAGIAVPADDWGD